MKTIILFRYAGIYKKPLLVQINHLLIKIINTFVILLLQPD
jgi:hypothetical protein